MNIQLLAKTCFLLLTIASSLSWQASAAVDDIDKTFNTIRTENVTFRELGTAKNLTLRGNDASVGTNFGVRNDEIITKAKLRVSYVYSPSLIQRLSHIKVYLNEEVLGILPMNNANAGHKHIHELEIDPILLTGYNNLRMQMVGHYITDQCEYPRHTSIWADISGKSSLQLTLQSLPLSNRLDIFPEPFFDEHSPKRLTLPFIFAQPPSLTTMEAAGILSSWFGTKAAWRGARFPVSIDKSPKQHAVVFATNANRPEFLQDYPLVDEPTIAIISLPLPELESDELDNEEPKPRFNPYIKLLLVLGKNDEDLKIASQALTLGQATLTGQQATVKFVELGPKRSPYDAPNWVRLDRPTKLGELVNSLTELQVAGHTPQGIRVNMRIPADLFTWRSKGIPVDLKYRYTPLVEEDESRLNVNINEQFVEAFNLKSSGKGGVKQRVRVPLLDEGLFGTGNEFYIPAFKLGSNNQINFSFSFATQAEGLCKTGSIENVQASIDADSTIDFTGFPHYAALPNLGFFANSGYPYSVHADLAKTVLVLSNNPTVIEMEVALTLLGRMGISTGYPATRVAMEKADSLDLKIDKDIIIIGNKAHDVLLQRWGKELPNHISKVGRELGLPAREVNLLNDWMGFQTEPDPSLTSAVHLKNKGSIASIMGFESPQVSEKSVVSLIAASNKGLLRILDAFENSTEVSQMHGSTILLKPNSIESILVGNTYTVGNLSFSVRVWYFLSQHPVILAFLTLISILIASFLIWKILGGIMSQRTRDEH